jgi:CRP-like cAMP-binding protein
MDSARGLLVQQPLLRNLDPAHVDLLRPLARLVSFAPGSFVLRAGDTANEFVLLTKGTVAVRAASNRHPTDDATTIVTLTAGEFLGASWLLSERRWCHDAIAMDAVEGFAVDVNDFLIVCDKEHDFAYRVMTAIGQVLAQRLRETRLQMLDVYAH